MKQNLLLWGAVGISVLVIVAAIAYTKGASEATQNQSANVERAFPVQTQGAGCGI